MHVITADQLRRAVPKCAHPDAWVEPLNEAMLRYGISDDIDYMVEFLAQGAHESSSFNRLEESLSYTAERLVEVWPKRFPSITVAAQYARAPHKLADHVYGGRLGNEKPGDGWTYRGRGIHMVTGRANYALVDRLLNMRGDLVRCPEKLCTKRLAALASAAWWESKPRLNQLADDTAVDDDHADLVSISRIVNGGTIGLAERARLRESFKAALSATR